MKTSNPVGATLLRPPQQQCDFLLGACGRFHLTQNLPNADSLLSYPLAPFRGRGKGEGAFLLTFGMQIIVRFLRKMAVASVLNLKPKCQ